MLRTQPLVAVGAMAAMSGGAMWIVKGTVILITGDQPQLMFEIPGLLFPFALMGLHDLLRGQGERRAAAGGLLARIALAMATGVAIYGVVEDDPSDAILGVGIGLTASTIVGALVLLGPAARAVGALPETLRNLPLVMGLAAVPVMTVLGGILEAVHERLLELPIVAYGGAWVAVGVVLWSARGATERSAPEGGRAKGTSTA